MKGYSLLIAVVVSVVAVWILSTSIALATPKYDNYPHYRPPQASSYPAVDAPSKGEKPKEETTDKK